MKFCKAHSFDRRIKPHLVDIRARAIFLYANKWVSGSKITYSFIGGDAIYRNAIRNAAMQWALYADLNFHEVESNGMIRVAFDQNDGSWSYIGREVLNVPANEPTMNIGWSPQEDPNVCLHEWGHALDLVHEHSNTGITWNRSAVINDLSGPPNNWDIQTIEDNVFYVYPRDLVTGNDVIDPNSVMMYDLPKEWILAPPEYAKTGIHPAGGISEIDKLWAATVYPKAPAPPPVEGYNLKLDLTNYLSPGKQTSLVFYVPDKAVYALGTTGKADTVCVLFEDGVQVAANDDSDAEDRNALIKWELSPNKKYTLTTRLYYKTAKANVGIYVTRA